MMTEVRWHVQSHSNPDTHYEVSCRRGPEGVEWECGCIGWYMLSTRYPGRQCRHIKSCEAILLSRVQRMYYSTDPYHPVIEHETES